MVGFKTNFSYQQLRKIDEPFGVQDYIDSMEGATLSGRQAAAYICDAGEELAVLRKKIATSDARETGKDVKVADELSLV